MFDTLIVHRDYVSRDISHTQQPQKPFKLGTAEIVESVEATQTPLLGIINAVLAKESMSRQELLLLRARLRRYSSEVNLLASLLRALVKPGRLPLPARGSGEEE